MADAAGQFEILQTGSKVELEILFPESFSDDDSIKINLENLIFRRTTPGNPGTIYEYTCGIRSDKNIKIQLHEDPAAGNFGVFSAEVSGMKVSRGAWDEGYDLFSDVNTALRAEAARQEAARQAKLKGRNVATLKKTLLAPVSETSKAANVLSIPGLGNKVAEFLSGKTGTVNQQVTALKRNAGVPNARRRKTRRRRD